MTVNEEVRDISWTDSKADKELKLPPKPTSDCHLGWEGARARRQCNIFYILRDLRGSLL